MSTTICTQCRAAQHLLRRTTPKRTSQWSTTTTQQPNNNSRSPFSTTSPYHRDPTPSEILAKPTWSVRSLLPPPPPPSPSPSTPSTEVEEEEITPETLRHLLRLSALPPPATPAEESQLLATLRAQLHFVRRIQSIDTSKVGPLVSVRDETAAGVREQTVGLAALEAALAAEDVVGHARRPRRRRARSSQQIEGVEDWDVLKGASEKVGRYFVVRSGPGK